MKIIQILPELNFGGVERGTIDFAIMLADKGHSSIVISAGGKLVEKLNQHRIKHYQMPVHKKNLFCVIKMISQVRKIIESERPDIIHARSRIPAIIAFFASRKSDTQFITTAHGYYSNSIFSKVMGWGKYVIVPSNVTGRHMIEDFGVPFQRIRLIPRGIDLNEFKFLYENQLSTDLENPFLSKKGNQIIIAIIGRIVPNKGHKIFLRAVGQLIRNFSNTKVWIIGDAPKGKEKYKEEIDFHIRRFGIERYVEFMGGRKDISKLLSKIDILVLATTNYETFGRVIIEAGAVGVPVVATKVGGVVDIIDNKLNGLLVPPNDYNAMANAMMQIIKNPELTWQMVKNARKKIENNYTLNRMGESTINIYKEVIKVKRILVLKISSVGDVILVIPSLRSIREKYPNAYIAVLVGFECSQIIQNCPYVDDVIIYNKQHIRLKEIFNIAKKIKNLYFDFSIDFQNNKFSRLVTALGCVPKRYGYENGKYAFLLTNKVKFLNPLVQPVDHQFRLLNAAGIAGSVSKLQLWPSPEDYQYIEDFLEQQWLAKDQILIGFNLCGSIRWQTKKWPIKSFAVLSDELALKYNARVILTGTNEDEKAAKEFIKYAQNKPINAVGKTSILQLACLISKCNVYVSTDSAPMHIASAMGIPFIALFGPTDFKRHLPPAKHYRVLHKNKRCSPCYKSKCSHTKCMSEISVEEVMEAIEELLTV